MYSDGAEFSHEEHFVSQMGDTWNAKYESGRGLGWITGGELDGKWIPIVEGCITEPIFLASDESLWIEGWWAKATGTRLITFASMMDNPQLPRLGNRGGRPVVEELSNEERPIMRLYDNGTRPADVARALGLPNEEVQNVVNRVRRRRRRRQQ